MPGTDLDRLLLLLHRRTCDPAITDKNGVLASYSVSLSSLRIRRILLMGVGFSRAPLLVHGMSSIDGDGVCRIPFVDPLSDPVSRNIGTRLVSIAVFLNGNGRLILLIS